MNYSIHPLATHTQLEAQLSDAFREDEDEEAGFVSLSVNSTNSDSDSDTEDHKKSGRIMSPSTPFIRDQLNPLTSIEASMISVDLVASNIMTSSVVDVEVNNNINVLFVN